MAGLIPSQVLGMVVLAGARGTESPRFPQALCEMELQQQPRLPRERRFTPVWLSERNGVLDGKCHPGATYPQSRQLRWSCSLLGHSKAQSHPAAFLPRP